MKTMIQKTEQSAEDYIEQLLEEKQELVETLDNITYHTESYINAVNNVCINSNNKSLKEIRGFLNKHIKIAKNIIKKATE